MSEMSEAARAYFNALRRDGEELDDVARRIVPGLADFAAVFEGQSAPESPKGRPPQRRKRAARGTVTGTDFYKPVLARVLLRAPDRAMGAAEAIREVGKLVTARLSDIDRAKLSNDQPRWENKVQWARDELVKQGLILPTKAGGRGIWKLTEKGQKYAEKCASN